MYRFLILVSGLMLGALFSFSAQEEAGVVEGTVKKLDVATGTIIVKTAHGTDHTFHFVDRTAVYGTKEAAKGTKETLHGLKKGNEVVVHYANQGTAKTAEEIDYIGKDGLKTGEGTITKIDRDAKTLTVKSADGAQETYRLSQRAGQDAGKDIVEGGKKSEKVTVYYTEEAGHKVAHFFKKIL